MYLEVKIFLQPFESVQFQIQLQFESRSRCLAKRFVNVFQFITKGTKAHPYNKRLTQTNWLPRRDTNPTIWESTNIGIITDSDSYMI